MILKPTTTLYVVCKADGSCGTMSLNGYTNAINGGLNPDTIVVTTCQEEANKFARKYTAIAEVARIMEGLDHIDAQKVVHIVEKAI